MAVGRRTWRRGASGRSDRSFPSPVPRALASALHQTCAPTRGSRRGNDEDPTKVSHDEPELVLAQNRRDFWDGTHRQHGNPPVGAGCARGIVERTRDRRIGGRRRGALEVAWTRLVLHGPEDLAVCACGLPQRVGQGSHRAEIQQPGHRDGTSRVGQCVEDRASAASQRPRSAYRARPAAAPSFGPSHLTWGTSPLQRIFMVRT
jgi:hypothetical protein